jgi:hypothetical protein
LISPPKKAANGDCARPGQQQLTVSFLGTGSASPSKTRNNSAILLSISSHPQPSSYSCGKEGNIFSILLDAGEGCVAQLFYLCSGDLAKFRERLLSISLIWISHHHADHHCGLPLLLQHIYTARQSIDEAEITIDANEKILVVASEEVIRYQEYCACVAGYDDLIEFVDISLTATTPPGQFYPSSVWDPTRRTTEEQIVRATSGIVSSLCSIPVYHCKHAFALRLSLTVFDCREPKKQIVVVYRYCILFSPFVTIKL